MRKQHILNLEFWITNILIVFLFFIPLSANAKKEKIAPPTFSHDSGFYPEPFDLFLSHTDHEATIYYTLDGSDPDPKNLNGKTFRYKNNYSYPV